MNESKLALICTDVPAALSTNHVRWATIRYDVISDTPNVNFDRIAHLAKLGALFSRSAFASYLSWLPVMPGFFFSFFPSSLSWFLDVDFLFDLNIQCFKPKSFSSP